ncbi:MAG: glycosyltransferase family 2 protein [Bacteroidia bacterium]|nr:glycosyltransferase family 2 protein [Bacteroidia bacterium]
MKLQILVPQYKETEEIIKPLLDSIALQQNVNLTKDVGVIIVNDGTEVRLSEDFLKSYPFEIKYILNEHKGVSSTRNCCLDNSKADYICFCDSDDMFYNMCGLWIILREIECGGFDCLISDFIEEGRMPDKQPFFLTRENDCTFVHGKVYRRKYLLKNNIRWADELTIHEDSYFNVLCQKLTNKIKHCTTPFYLWKWRDDSICRRDAKYLLKTYYKMLDSNTLLVQEFINREKIEFARFYATSMIYDSYFTMNKAEWINQENKEYRDNTEKRFKEYYLRFKKLFEEIDMATKSKIITGIKNRFFTEGLFMESITFEDWINHIVKL